MNTNARLGGGVQKPRDIIACLFPVNAGDFFHEGIFIRTYLERDIPQLGHRKVP